MALKGDRNVIEDEIGFFCNETATRGIIMVHGTSGSGVGLDQELATVVKPTGGVSGSRPVGLLLNDVVNYDLTRQHINWHQDETQIGGKVILMKKGWCVTNSISGTPLAGDRAFYNTDGSLTNFSGVVTIPSSGDNQWTQVGRFLTKKDADGYARVEINIV